MLKFKAVNNVTRPLLKFDNDVKVYVTFEAKFYQADPAKGVEFKDGKWLDAKGDITAAPPMLANVKNLENGVASQIIVNEVLLQELNKAYPDGAYIGKSFELSKHSIEGKRYKGFSITEIELDEEEKLEYEPIEVEEKTPYTADIPKESHGRGKK